MIKRKKRNTLRIHLYLQPKLPNHSLLSYSIAFVSLWCTCICVYIYIYIYTHTLFVTLDSTMRIQFLFFFMFPNMASHAFTQSKKCCHDPLTVFRCTFFVVHLLGSFSPWFLAFDCKFCIPLLLCSWTSVFRFNWLHLQLILEFSFSSSSYDFHIAFVWISSFLVHRSLLCFHFFFIFIMPPRAVLGHLQQDTYFAFFVHPNEGPNYLIVSPKFSGSNYLPWNRSMQHALGTKNK